MTTDPAELYEREILPRLHALERQRLSARTWVVFVTLGMIAGTVIAVIKLPVILKLGKYAKLLGCVFFAVPLIPIALFRSRRKRMFVPLVLRLTGHADLAYSARPSLKPRELLALGGWDGCTVSAEDGVTGLRCGLRFHFNEVTVKRHGGSSGGDTVFRGWLLCLDAPTPAGRFAIEFHTKAGGTVSEALVTEGTPGEARLQLSPAVLRHAAALAEIAGARKARATLADGRFTLVIETNRDIFESIADAEAKLSQEAFVRLVRELDGVTGTVDGIAAELTRRFAASPTKETVEPGAGPA